MVSGCLRGDLINKAAAAGYELTANQDTDGDGIPDLMLKSKTGGIAIRNLAGNLAVTDLGAAGIIGSQVKDLNGDGIADITVGQDVYIGSVTGEYISASPDQAVRNSSLVGSTAGAFRVDESGAATYSIPIQVAPGTADVQPQLSLDYSSQGGDGLLGVGWQLSAGSAISRCPKDLTRDGMIAGIKFDRSDRLCLDGQKLIPNGYDNNNGISDSSYWSATAYHLEVDDYSVIKPLGTRSADGSPAAFERSNKAGEKHFYGDITRADIKGYKDRSGSDNSADAFVEAGGSKADGSLLVTVDTKARAWVIKAIADVKENYILYRYEEKQASGEHYLAAIEYSGQKSGYLPRNYVKFDYIPRTNPRSGWFAGSQLASLKLLDKVTSFDGSDPLRQYSLIYAAKDGVEAMPHVQQIQDCAAKPNDEWACLKPLVFDTTSPAYSEAPALLTLSPGANSDIKTPITVVSGNVASAFRFKDPTATSVKATGADHARLLDMNGDGAIDQLFPENGKWKLRLGFGREGAAEPLEMFSSVVDKPEHVQLMDADGDGRTDLLFRKEGNWWLGRYKPAPDRYEVVETCSMKFMGYKSYGNEPILEKVCVSESKASSFHMAAVEISGGAAKNAIGYEGGVVISDVNGDGLEDIVFKEASALKAYINTSMDGKVSFKLQNAALFTFEYAENFANRIINSNADIENSSWVDFNGDGRTDLLLKHSVNYFYCGDPQSSNRKLISPDETCNGPITGVQPLFSWAILVAQPTSPTVDARYTVVGNLEYRVPKLLISDVSSVDLNGDGLSDLVYVKGSRWHYRLSRGDGTFGTEDKPLLKILPNNTTEHLAAKDYSFYRTTFTDINGDGNSDILWGRTTSDWDLLLSRALAGTDEIRLVKVGSINVGDTQHRQLTDIDGDGRLDLLTAKDSSSNWQIRFNGQQGQKRHYAINRITDGHGIYTDVHYSQLTNNAIYLADYSLLARQQPHRYLPVPPSSAWAVAQVASLGRGAIADDGKKENIVSYRYGGATLDKKSGSYLGFEQLSTMDHQSGIKTISYYFQEGRKSGIPSRTESYFGDKLIGASQNELAELTTANGAKIPYIQKTTDWSWDLQLPEETKHKMAVTVNSFGYDNWGNLTSSTSRVFPGVANVGDALATEEGSTHTVNEYNGAGGGATKGRLSATTVTKKRKDKADITRKSTFAYHSSGLLKTSIVDPDNSSKAQLTTSYDYDAWGNQTSVTVTGGVNAAGTHQSRNSTVLYSSNGRLVKQRTNALGETETYLYNGKDADSVSGRVWSMTTTGPNKIATTQFFDAQGQMVREVRADGTRTSITTRYIPNTSCNGSNSACFEVETQTSGAPTTWARFNAFGHEVEKRSQLFTSSQISVVTTQYDQLGRTMSVSEPYWSNAQPAYYTYYEYDPFGRVIKETAPDGAVSSMVYRGSATDFINPKNQRRTETRNLFGELAAVRVEKTGSEDNSESLISYGYDAFGNLVATRIGKNSADTGGTLITAKFDSYGRKTSMIDPDKGSWSYVYNAFGELVSQTSNGLQLGISTYDMAGRKFRETVAIGHDGKPLTRCWYFGNKDQIAQRAVGKLVEVRQYESADVNCANPGSLSAAYSERYSYDRLGRPQGTTTAAEGKTFSHSTSYDASGRVSSQTYPEGFVVTQSYTTIGALEKITDSTNKRTLRTINSVNAAGQVLTETLAAGVSRINDYAPETGYLNNINISQSGKNYHNLSYKHDKLGNVTERNQSFNGNAIYAAETFGYDSNNRLISRDLKLANQLGGATNFKLGKQSYSYDNFGNLTAKDGRCYVYDPAKRNRLQAVKTGASCSGTNYRSYQYDSRGNVESDGARTLDYTSFDKPYFIERGSNQSSFKYGPDEQRYWRQDDVKEVNRSTNQPYSEATRYTTWQLPGYERVERRAHGNGERPALVEHKYSVGGAVISRTVQADNSHTWRTHILHSDNQGSVISITDGDNGALVQQFIYDPWGHQSEISSDRTLTAGLARGEVTQRGYTGHEMLKGVELIHMNGRVYDAEIGRFLQADPFIQTPNNAQNYNRYSYVLNNPMSYTDPSGYFLKKLVKSVKKAVRSVIRALGPEVSSILVGIGSFFCGPVFAPLCAAAGSYEVARAFGASPSGALRAGAIAGASAYAFQQIGNYYSGASGANAGGYGAMGRPDLASASFTNFGGNYLTAGQIAGQITAHAVVGGVTAVASGGKFGHGFVAAGFAKGIGTPIYDMTGGNAAAGFMATVVVGGTVSELSGGKFANGAKTAAFLYLLSAASKYYEDAVGRKANPLPGENGAPSDYSFDSKTGQQFSDTWNQNVIGLNEPLNGAWYAPSNFFKQGGILSRALNLLPTVNATAGLHDYWFNAPQPQGLDFTLINNVGTMLPAAAISMGASLGNLTQGWQSNPMALYLLTQPYDRNRR